MSFFKWRIQWHDMFGNTFSIIYAPQNLAIESRSKDLRLLVSEIDVSLCNWPPFFKWSPKWRIQWHYVLGNIFSEIYAPERVDNDSDTPLSF